MGYTLPPEQFNAIEHAKDTVIRANQFEELVLQQFRMAYEDFWGVTPGQGSKYTTEQMQAKLDVMPQATAVDILTDAARFKEFVKQAYPGMLEEMYHDSAWVYHEEEGRLVLDTLREIWQTPDVPE